MSKPKSKFHYDFFIAHAVEDREEIVSPIVKQLKEAGAKVWYSGEELRAGQNISEEVSRAIRHSRFGIVVATKKSIHSFYVDAEVSAMFEEENSRREKMIIPVCHKITVEEFKRKFTLQAARFSINTNIGIGQVVEELMRVSKGEVRETPQSPETQKGSGIFSSLMVKDFDIKRLVKPFFLLSGVLFSIVLWYVFFKPCPSTGLYLGLRLLIPALVAGSVFFLPANTLFSKIKVRLIFFLLIFFGGYFLNPLALFSFQHCGAERALFTNYRMEELFHQNDSFPSPRMVDFAVMENMDYHRALFRSRIKEIIRAKPRVVSLDKIENLYKRFMDSTGIYYRNTYEFRVGHEQYYYRKNLLPFDLPVENLSPRGAYDMEEFMVFLIDSYFSEKKRVLKYLFVNKSPLEFQKEVMEKSTREYSIMVKYHPHLFGVMVEMEFSEKTEWRRKRHMIYWGIKPRESYNFVREKKEWVQQNQDSF